MVEIAAVTGSVMFVVWKRHQARVRGLKQGGVSVLGRITKITPVPAWRRKFNLFIPWWDFTYEFNALGEKIISHRVFCSERWLGRGMVIGYFRPWLDGVSFESVGKIKEGDQLKIIFDPNRPWLNYPEAALPDLMSCYNLATDDVSTGQSILFIIGVLLFLFLPLFIKLLAL